MTEPFGKIVSTSVAKQISETIKDAIIDGRLQVGERLPTEDELATRYAVSRPTVREALKRLAAQHLVRSRRGPTGGNFVAEPDPAAISESLTGAATLLVSVGAFHFDEITTARLELQSVCIRLASEGWQQADMAAMEDALQAHLDRSISDEAFCAADVRFHRAIVNATHNRALQFVMYAVIEAFLPITNLIVFKTRSRDRIIKYHSDILANIKDRRAEEATRSLQELICYIRQQYLTASTSKLNEQTNGSRSRVQKA